MIKGIYSQIKNLWKTEEHEDIITPMDAKAEFVLHHKQLNIGKLFVKDGVWTFEYTDDFRNSLYQKLIDFPDVNKTYHSNHLWPFFSYRIPGLAQPQVQKILKDENIDKHNEVDLLVRFGKHTIANPFQLSAIPH